MFKAILFVVWLLTGSIAQSQTAPAAVTGQLTSLELWDQGMDNLKRGAWQFQALTAAGITDHLGTTPLQSFEDNVLTANKLSQIDALRNRASQQLAAGDEAGLQKTFREAELILMLELFKAAMISSYWGSQLKVQKQLQILQPWLTRASEVDQQSVANFTASTQEMLHEQLNQALSAREFLGEMFYAQWIKFDEKLAHYNAERQRLVNQQRDLPNPIPLAPRNRREACPASTPPMMEGDATRAQKRDIPSPEAFFPRLAQELHLSGKVDVKVTVSETGCAESAEIAQTTGVKELDEAAMDLALSGNYVAAFDGTKTVREAMTLRVNWNLEMPPPPAPFPSPP